MTLPWNRAASRMVVRDSGVDHAAYERTIGSLAHRLIAALCRGELDLPAEPSYEAARRFARDAMRSHPITRGRLAIAQQTAVVLLAYWAELLPDIRLGYRLIGAELRFGSRQVDLAWELCPGPGRGVTCFIDEIKTGSWHGQASDRARHQVDALVAAGRGQFGARFAGLRFLTLTDPAGRHWVASDGTWSPLPDGWRPGID